MPKKSLRVAYSYVRFSSPEQMKGHSLRRQKEESAKYAKENGLTIDHDLKLQDLGVSAYRGKNASEGALAGFLEAIKGGRVVPGSTLLVESLDRLSRDEIPAAMAQFLLIVNSGITIVTLLDKMVYSRETIKERPESLFVSLGVMMRAHNESDDKSKRIGMAWAQKRENARENKIPISKNCPGWLCKMKTRYRIIPKRAEVVRRIFQMAADGMGKRTITKVLNHEGVPTWGGKSWYDSHIWKLLFNPAVLGTFQPRRRHTKTGKYVPDGDPILNYFPAVITPQEWQAAKSRPSAPRGPRSLRIGNLFTGLVFCGYTGHTMRFSSRGKNSYLRSDLERFASDATPQSWPYWHLEKTVLKYLHELDWQTLLDPKGDPEKDRLQAKVASLSLDISQKRAAINRIIDGFAGEEIIPSLAKAAQERAAKIAAEVETAETTLQEVSEELKTHESQTAAISSGIAEFKALISAGSPKERLRLQTEIRRRVSRINCYRDGAPNEFGLILSQAPAIQICFSPRKSRWILIGTDNPLRKQRKADEKRRKKPKDESLPF